MNKLLSALLYLAASFWLAACQQDPQSVDSVMRRSPSNNGGTAAAHPALAYIGQTIKHNSYYQTVAVMDTDCTHQTNLYIAQLAGTIGHLNVGGTGATWSPAGDQIAFAERTSSSNPAAWSLKRLGISVINGVPTGSNVTTLYTGNVSDTATCYALAYSSTTSANKIAFSLQTGSARSVQWCRLYTISAAGGTPTLVWSSPGTAHHEIHSITWNADDSKLAFIDNNGSPYQSVIRIVDASTGSQVDTIAVPYYNATTIEWSRGTLNTLAVCTQDTNSGPTGTDFGFRLRYCAATTGAAFSTDGIVGMSATWSPNNSSLFLKPAVYGDYDQRKATAFSSSYATFTNAPQFQLRVEWKR